MLDRRARIKSTEVAHIQKNGKKRSTKHFFLSYLEGTQTSAFGVMAPKGADITGVSRNRLRRRVYTFLQRRTMPALIQGVMGMVGARKGAYTLSGAEIEGELTILLSPLIHSQK